MTDETSPKPANYTVGYRRPPKETRFKPGQSGNPRGRPKGIRSIGAILQGIIQQKIAVTENGKTRRMPVIEVMCRRLTNDAMRSDQKAIKLLFTLVDRYGDSPQATVQLSELLAEDEAILAQYLPEPATPSASPSEGGDDDDV